jgi:hypothetical protein
VKSDTFKSMVNQQLCNAHQDVWLLSVLVLLELLLGLAHRPGSGRHPTGQFVATWRDF